jgi:hypothetical protein
MTKATQYIMLNGRACRRVEPAPTVLAEPSTLNAFVGSYVGDAETVDVRIEGDRLLVRAARRENKELPCVVLDTKRFASKIGVFELRSTDDGAAPILIWAETITFQRLMEGRVPALATGMPPPCGVRAAHG